MVVIDSWPAPCGGKTPVQFFIFLLVILAAVPVSHARNFTDSGFGTYPVNRHPPMTDLTAGQRERIWQEIRSRLKTLSPVSEKKAADDAQMTALSWPLQASDYFTAYDFHGISGFVDQDPAYPDQVLDYNCGDRSYDTASGYNHEGTDFFLWPFSFNLMYLNEIDVIAAAPGTIIGKHDGGYDRNCRFNSSDWNAVYVQHDDGSIAWYGHLKQCSLTSKATGSRVDRGEYLGKLGSSGNSTGPHLHLELYDSSGRLVDPFYGPCNSLQSSVWNSQRAYYDSGVNRLMTHSSQPSLGECAEPATINARNVFKPGDRVYFAVYYRDQLDTQKSDYTIFRPDGSVYETWSHYSNAPFYSAAYWYWSYDLEPDAAEGIWSFQVQFNSRTYSHQFRVTGDGTYDSTEAGMGIVGLNFNISDSPGVGEAVPVAVNGTVSGAADIHYQYYYRANYGTAGYDTTPWTLVKAYSTEPVCEYTFPAAGNYIVVARAVMNPADEPASLPIIGGVVSVGNSAGVTLNRLYRTTTGPVTANQPATFRVDAVAGSTVYYRFYYRADYGTDRYASAAWTLVRDYAADPECDFLFPSKGDYIVVARAVTDPENEPAALPIIGAVVTVE